MGSNSFKVPRRDCLMFEPERLVLDEDPNNPFYDPRVHAKLDEGLVQSVMGHGVIQPITIKREGETAVVVDGRQRVRAALEANKRLAEKGADPVRVPCTIQRGSDVDLYALTIIANEHRLDDDPLAKAEKCARYLGGGRTEEEAAICFGVTRTTIRNWMKILDLASPIKKAIRSGEIAASAAAKLADLPVDEQTSALEEARQSSATGKPTNDAAAGVARSRKAKNGKKPRSVRRKKEVQDQLETWGDAPFAPILKWFLGEEVDFEELCNEQGWV